MKLWFVFALMTAAAVFAVLWPLGRRPRGKPAAARRRFTATSSPRSSVTAGGLIRAAEAEAARVEISRRLLAAADPSARPARGAATQTAPGGGRHRPGGASAGGVAALPSAGIAAARAISAGGAPKAIGQPLDKLVAQVEAHLEKNPTDGQGWTVLAPVLTRLGRFDDAVRACATRSVFRRDAERRADLGEAQTAAANGVVTADAKANSNARCAQCRRGQGELFPRARRRAGRPQGRGASIWKAMLAKAPADAPYRPLVQAAWRGSAARPSPALSEETMAAAKDMNGRPRRHDPRYGGPAASG